MSVADIVLRVFVVAVFAYFSWLMFRQVYGYLKENKNDIDWYEVAKIVVYLALWLVPSALLYQAYADTDKEYYGDLWFYGCVLVGLFMAIWRDMRK